MPSIRSQIADAFLARVALVMDIKTSSFDRVRLLDGDFAEWELPAVQLIDGEELNVHEMLRGRKTWPITVELVIGPIAATGYEPTQKKLWDLIEAIENSVMSEPKLGLAKVLHVKLLGSNTDQGLLHPFYTARINFTVDYYQNLVGEC